MELSLQKIKANYLEPSKIEASDIWDEYVNFEHENILITAPSGTGKTSLFNILYLKHFDSSGDYFINGTSCQKLNDKDISKLRESSISVVFQDLRLFDDLSLIDNLLLKNDLTHHYSLEEIKSLIVQVGLKEQMYQKTKTLSFGQKQRAAVIRALCQPFEWLILDEPFSHLDSNNIAIIRSLILKELEKRSANIILLSLEDHYDFPFDKKYAL